MRRIYILVLFVAFLAIFLFVSNLFGPKQPTQTGTLPQSSPTPTITANIKFVTVSPPNNPTIKYLPIQQVSITYNTVVTPNKVFVVSSPSVSTTIRQGDNPSTIIISSNPSWNEGITKLSVYVSGGAEPVMYELNTGEPPHPDPDSDY